MSFYKEDYFYRNSGTGKVAALFNFSGSISLNKNNITVYALITSYNYLKTYCGYDRVHIAINRLSNVDVDKITNDLRHYIDDLIVDVTDIDLLVKLNVNDVIVHNPSENYFGGVISNYLFFDINCISNWKVNHKNDSNHLFILQDDPEFFQTNPTAHMLNRLFVENTLKVLLPKDEDTANKITEAKYWMKNNQDVVKQTFESVDVAFVGIDYEEFWNNIDPKKRPSNVRMWCKFESYIWQGVNYCLDEKLKDYPFDEKRYDCVYCGTNKKPSRTKHTESFYSSLDKKFLHIYRKKPFFIKLKEGEHYDSIQNIEFSDLYKVQCSQCKTSLVTHNPEVIGNQVSPRYFDMMLGDIVTLLDARFDSKQFLITDEELKKLMYVSSPEDFAQKVKKISNNEELYRKIKKMQRLAVYEVFKEYIEPVNLEYFNKIKEGEA